MVISELIEHLREFSPDAKVQVVVDSYPQPFELCFGGSEGCTKSTADDVSFVVGGERDRENNGRK